MKASHFFYFLASAALVISLSIVVFLLASGYRFDPKTGTIKGTGIISITSIPNGALIYINDVPKNATDTSIVDLSPGTYTIKLTKEGYHSWQKTVAVKKELVTKIDALLLPQYPTIQPLTFTGATNPVLSPDGQKIIYSVDTGTSMGIWFIDLEERPFNLSRKPQLLLADTTDVAYSQSSYSWSPASDSILIEFPSEITSLNAKYQLYTISNSNSTYTLDPSTILANWQTQITTRDSDKLSLLSSTQQDLIRSLSNVNWSPDGKYITYTTTNDEIIDYHVLTVQPADFPTIQEPSPTSEEQKTDVIVFQVNKNTPASVEWFPDSQHLIITQKVTNTTSIEIVEISGENNTQIFSGDIDNLQVYPNLSGSKIIVLTNFNAELKNYNLYTIDLQ